MHAYADARAHARDRAFERLYRRYVKDVYRYTLALLRNPADAEDVTQTTFLNAYRAFRRGEEPLKPQNWLITIAHNACRTRYLRASRRPQEVPLEWSLREVAVPDEEIPDVKEVLDALAKLPFNQRAALVMRELEGRSYADIARALDVTVPAVETLIFRARRALRVRRSALRTLAALPLPASLSSFSGGAGAGAVAAGGGALFGSGLLLKAVLAVGVGVVAVTAGPTVEAKVVGGTGVIEERHVPGRVTASGGGASASGSPAAVRAEQRPATRAARTAGSSSERATEREQGHARQLPRRGGVAKSSSPGTATGGTVAPVSPPSGGASAAPASPPPPSPAPVTETVAKTVPTPAVPVPVEAAPVAVPSTPSAPAVPPPPALPPAPALPPPPPLPPPPLPPPPALPPPPSLP